MFLLDLDTILNCKNTRKSKKKSTSDEVDFLRMVYLISPSRMDGFLGNKIVKNIEILLGKTNVLTGSEYNFKL